MSGRDKRKMTAKLGEASKARGKRGKADERHPASEKPVPAGDEVIRVCLGEFGIEQAREFRALWEATWSQDARSRPTKK